MFMNCCEDYFLNSKGKQKEKLFIAKAKQLISDFEKSLKEVICSESKRKKENYVERLSELEVESHTLEIELLKLKELVKGQEDRVF